MQIYAVLCGLLYTIIIICLANIYLDFNSQT